MMTIDAMIPVYRPDGRLYRCVERLLAQKRPVRRITLVCSVDGSWDMDRLETWCGTKERTEIQKISPEDFDNGGTRRQWAEEEDADILLFLSQDAVPADRYLTERLARRLLDRRFGAVYARQLPGFGCSEEERYKRYWTYPPESRVKGKKNGEIRDCFTSDVCAAYRRDWYRKAGGFEPSILLSEDSVLAFRLMDAGALVVYCAEAKVFHAHSHSLGTLWSRSFDIGAVHRMYRDIFRNQAAEKEGFCLVISTAGYLLGQRKPWLLPGLFVRSTVRFLAYQCGKHYTCLPERLVEKWSLHKGYWRRKEEGGKEHGRK